LQEDLNKKEEEDLAKSYVLPIGEGLRSSGCTLIIRLECPTKRLVWWGKQKPIDQKRGGKTKESTAEKVVERNYLILKYGC